MSDIERLKRIDVDLEELTQAEADAEKTHNNAVDEIAYLQEQLSKVRNIRDREKDNLRAIKREHAELTKERDEVKIRIETQASSISNEYLSKLDRRAAKFKWDKFIKPKQREGAYRIAYNRNMLLGDEMGTGKTITSIAAADLTLTRHLLVLVPAKLAGNFASEFSKWAPHRFVLNLAQQTGPVRGAQFMMLRELHKLRKPTVLILNYESWASNYSILSEIEELQFDGVIMDEAHNFKNPKTHAYQGIKRLVGANNTCVECKGVISKINSRCRECNWDSTNATDADFIKMKSMRKLILPMTGTFLMNNPADIWPALNIIMPRTFDKLKTFLDLFAQQGDNGKWYFKDGGADRLTRQLGPKYLKRTMEDMGIDLPTQTVKSELISLDGYDEQRQILDDLAKNAALEMADGEIVNITAIIAQITRQRQAAADPNGIKIEVGVDQEGMPITESLTCRKVAKIDWLENKVSEDVLFNGKRVAVFSQFSSIFPEIKRRLESLGIKVVICDGNTSRVQMETIRSDFDRNSPDKGKYQVVLANFRVGGAGLNFTDITQTYEFDSPWNPALRDQAKARTRRIGQTEETDYTILELAGTIDEWMRTLVQMKHDMIDGFNMAAEGASVDMTELLKQALTKGVK